MALLSLDALEEDQIWPVLRSLEKQFFPDFGCNLRTNIQSLKLIQQMDKTRLEGFLAQVSLISLNRDEYWRIQEKIATLLQQNLEAAREQWLEIE